MASDITKIIVIILILNLMIPANAMAVIIFPDVPVDPLIPPSDGDPLLRAAPANDDIWFEDVTGQPLETSAFTDTRELRLKFSLPDILHLADFRLDMLYRDDGGTWHRNYGWQPLYDFGDGVYGTGIYIPQYHNPVASGLEAQRLEVVLVSGSSATMKLRIDYWISPSKYRAPDIKTDDMIFEETSDGMISAKVPVYWSTGSDTVGSWVLYRWLPALSDFEPESSNKTATSQHGLIIYHDRTSDIPWNTPGWLVISACNNYGDIIIRTIALPYIQPTPVPTTPVPTTPIPTTVPTYVYPTVIPTGALTYPTPIPTAPIPTVTQAPIGTVPARGVPTWSSGLRITPETLPVAATPTLRPIPMYVPQFQNISVPSWVRNPIPVVGPAATVSQMVDGWIDQTVTLIASPYDAMIRPFTTWIAGMAAGTAQAVNSLTTWITGFTTYIHGLGDMLWLLIPLPVWVAGSLMVWIRFVWLVILYLGSGADLALTEMLR